ncbi:MAG: DUF2812 domain-containing protein [Lachnospiraceae bacterium]|nr:DUF2812 domain-containing protein [Lachnospiraceae bacterium]
MSKVKIRFFAGFIESQTKWLNSMSAKGYRLVKTGKMRYVFEECEAGKYAYAVEYVGDKSFKEEENYKEFLEDMGYTVFYKNMNLDFSPFKITFRPWAEKGGKISSNTKRSTYNKELLIVEKERDGKPFELHTDNEDLANYYDRLSVPWVYGCFLFLLWGILAWPFMPVVCVAGAGALLCGTFFGRARHKIKQILKNNELEE